MANELAGYPYSEVRFGKAGRLVDPDDRLGVQRMVEDGAVTDLVCLAHGWNNDMDEARRLYRAMAASLRALEDSADAPLVAGRRLALMGVFWPSKKFAETDLIPGGAASFGTDPQEHLEHRIDDLLDAFDAADGEAKLAEARGLTSSLEDSASARRRFVELIRAAVPGGAGDDEDASRTFLDLDAEQLLAQLDDPTLDDPTWLPPVSDGAGGGAAVLGDGDGSGSGAGAGAGFGLGGMVKAAERLLNFATYYQMKARAGHVGERGLAPLLRDVTTPQQRIHLVGHSFGGRLVTAATASDDGVDHVDSLVLLQAAFSQFGFAQNWEPQVDGAFRRVLTAGHLAGPLIITHTRNDKAVGIAYAIASRIANQVGAEVGGPRSRFGGIGANGAQLTPEVEQLTLLPIEERYAFSRGRAYNLRADAFIADHSAVAGREVAHAILSCVGTS